MRRFQGDPRIFLDGDGAYFLYLGGQPVMDGGWENYALIKLLTEYWIGNVLFPENKVKIGGRFVEATKKPITISNLNNIQQEAEIQLRPMVQNNLASEIIVEVTNPKFNEVRTSILVKRPNIPDSELVLTTNGNNWIIQRDDHRRAS